MGAVVGLVGAARYSSPLDGQAARRVGEAVGGSFARYRVAVTADKEGRCARSLGVG